MNQKAKVATSPPTSLASVVIPSSQRHPKQMHLDRRLFGEAERLLAPLQGRREMTADRILEFLPGVDRSASFCHIFIDLVIFWSKPSPVLHARKGGLDVRLMSLYILKLICDAA